MTGLAAYIIFSNPSKSAAAAAAAAAVAVSDGSATENGEQQGDGESLGEGDEALSQQVRKEMGWSGMRVESNPIQFSRRHFR